MTKEIIQTDKAPQAIGSYSQAVVVGNLVFISGQIALNASGEFLSHNIEQQIHQVFNNLTAVCEAANASLENIVKLTVYLTDLGDFNSVNTIMSEYIQEPYPARAAVEVSALPRGAAVEMDAILSL